MHIALQIFTADKRRGGMERYTHDLATALTERGEKVTTIATRFADDWPGELQLVHVNGSRASQYRQFAAATIRADVIHTMQPVQRADVYTPHSGFAPTLYNRGRFFRRLANRFNAKRKTVRQLEQQLADSRTIFTCLSEAQALEAEVLYFGFDPGRVVIHHGVDTERFHPDREPSAGRSFRKTHGIPADARLALFISQNFKRKRLDFAIEALRRCDRDPHLLVVGRDDPSGYDRLSGRVHFVGELPDTYPAHAAADALILPTLDEPFGLVALESIAMGNPVVLYETAGAAEVVEHDRTGVIVNRPDDLSDWTDALERTLTPHIEWRAHCLARRDSLSFDRHVDALMKVYAEVR